MGANAMLRSQTSQRAARSPGFLASFRINAERFSDCGSGGTVQGVAEKVGKIPEAKAFLRERAISLD